MSAKQRGFTLIELVIVIVILGILAAIALPKYVDLAGDARNAVVDGTKGAIVAAAAIYIAQNKTAGNKGQIRALVSTANGVTIADGTVACSWNITPPGTTTATTYVLGTAGGLCVGP